jgi:hypothetical protein
LLSATQARQNAAAWDAVLYIARCHMDSNLVQHAVLMLSGNNTRSINNASANAVVKGQAELLHNTFAAWLERCSFNNNTLLSSDAGEKIAAALAAVLTMPPTLANSSDTDTIQVPDLLLALRMPALEPAAWVASSNSSNSSAFWPPSVQQQLEDVDEKSSMQLLPLPQDQSAQPAATASCEAFWNTTWPSFQKDALFPRIASVIWGSRGLIAGLGLSVSGNRGFPSALSHDVMFLHLEDSRFEDHTLASRLMEVWMADVVLKRVTIARNEARATELVLVQNARLAAVEVS